MKRQPLVVAHAEDMNIQILRGDLKYFREAVGRRSGIYILYKSSKPYYVGIASSMRGRLADHLEDHHRRKWDRFSFFEIRKQKYLKDVESLLIRGAKTKGKGNKSAPDFAKHNNISHAIKTEMKRHIDKFFE